MARILSTFSNLSGDLESLKQEYSSLFRFFNKSENKDKVDFEPYLNPKITEITSHILAAQKDIGLFHFSGHSGGGGLDFPEEEFSQQHLVDFFNTVNSDESKLDCVFLNGCENGDIVNKLLNVPVVIGTRTEIQDSVAEKFTRDFFSSLIGSESSYKKAFLDAVSAQSGLDISMIDRTRSEGAAIELEKEGALNEYFMVINDQKVAESKFPFKKKKINWTKFIALFLIVIVLITGFLFRDDILKLSKKYHCPVWNDDEKCRVLVADFNPDANYMNEVLAEGIGNNQLIYPYIESQHAASFAYFSGKSGIPDQELHAKCNYDFSLTGLVERIGDKIHMGFTIYSDHEEFENWNGGEIEIGNLFELNKMIQDVNLQSSNDFIVNRICIACADRHEELIAVVEKNLEAYARNTESPESYQNLNTQLFSLQKKRKDTRGMLVALNNIIKVGNNDYSLGALQRKAGLLLSEKRIEETYKTQSQYINEIHSRLRMPSNYKMAHKEESYFNNKNKMMVERGELVIKNHKELHPHLEQSLHDFHYLQEIRFAGKDYQREIEMIKELMAKYADEELFSLSGKIISQNEEPIANAIVRLDDQRKRTNSDGFYEFDAIPIESYLGQTFTVTKDGFNAIERRINEPADLEKLRLIVLDEADNNKRYVLNGNVMDCNHGSTILKELFIDNTSVPIIESSYSHVIFSKPGEQILIKPPSGYLFRQGDGVVITLGENTSIGDVFYVFSRPGDYRVVGQVSIFDDPLPGVSVKIKGTGFAAVTDMEGRFSMMAKVDLCSELECSLSGFRNKSILLKNFPPRGNTIDLGKINLENNGTEPGSNEPEYEVILQCDRVSNSRYQRLLNALKEMGHPVSSNSMNYESRPASFAEIPTVYYYANDRKEVAKILSIQMEEITGDDFLVKKYPVDDVIMTHIPVDNSSKIIIQWFRRIN